MSHETQTDFRLVYHGFDPMLAGMLARILEVEGITCRHVGTHFPAEIGLGALACEQRLEVPAHEAGRARELIAATGAEIDAATEAEADEGQNEQDEQLAQDDDAEADHSPEAEPNGRSA